MLHHQPRSALGRSSSARRQHQQLPAGRTSTMVVRAAASSAPSAPAATAGTARRAAAAALAAAVALATSAAGPASALGPVSVQLRDIRLERVACDSGVGSVGGVTFSGASTKAACLSVTAQAVNPEKKPLFNADVFGRVYDANGEPMTDDSENSRIAYIDEIAPGASTVTFRLNVPLSQFELGAPQLKGFKATGFQGGNLSKTGPGTVNADQLADCEILGNCEDLALEAAIR